MRRKKQLIAYYREGWRYGYLVKSGYKWTRIERILPKGSSMRRYLKVPTKDTKPLDISLQPSV